VTASRPSVTRDQEPGQPEICKSANSQFRKHGSSSPQPKFLRPQRPPPLTAFLITIRGPAVSTALPPALSVERQVSLRFRGLVECLLVWTQAQHGAGACVCADLLTEDEAEPDRGPSDGCGDNPNDVRASRAAFAEPANLSRKALEVEKQCLGPRPRKGASGRVLYSTAPWRGPAERPRVRRSFFLCPRPAEAVRQPEPAHPATVGCGVSTVAG